MPITKWTFLISCLAISGIAPFAGFFSKDEILGGAWSIVGQAAPPGWPSWYGYVLWGGLLIAALGTAFYMWRLYFLVFSGEERSEHAKHAHESPLSMTMPLVLLALFATIGGLIGLPHVFQEHLPHWWPSLERWLEPSVVSTWYNPAADGTLSLQTIGGHVADATTYVLMGLALGIGLLGIVIAWMLYGAGGRGPSRTVERLVGDHGRLHPIYEASKHKLWFDEVYDAILVRPFRVIARGLYEIVDRFIIDTIAVNGAAMVVALFGRISRWFQNGQVQRYLAGVVVGAACVFLITNCHAKPSFDYEIVGDRLHLMARPGAGLIGAGSKLRWDIDGDGQPDVDPNTGAIYDTPELYVLYGDTRSEVTLFIDDPITHKTKKITRVIERPAAAERHRADGDQGGEVVMPGSFVLPLLIGLPLIGAIFVMCTPKTETTLHRGLGLTVTAITFLVSLLCLRFFNPKADGFQLVFDAEWIPGLGAHFKTGVDGISVFLVLLTTFLMPLTLLGTAKSIEKHVREFIAAMLVLEAGMLGAFVALDIFVFYVFWEVMLIPMYLLIGIWGGQRRLYASIKFVIYTMVGSLLMLVAIFYVYVQYAQRHRHLHDGPREAPRGLAAVRSAGLVLRRVRARVRDQGPAVPAPHVAARRARRGAHRRLRDPGGRAPQVRHLRVPPLRDAAVPARRRGVGAHDRGARGDRHHLRCVRRVRAG